MKQPSVEIYCRDCEHTTILDHSECECPECGSRDIYKTRVIVCDCGTTVYLGGFTNECDGCGALYNGFGQRLADPSEWDEEDRYACFGPQY